MRILVDTNILGRLANRVDVAHAAANAAVAKLHRQGNLLHITAQNLVEFRNLATRPAFVNGLGMSAATAEYLSGTFEANFHLLEETPDIFPTWKLLVAAAGVTGKQVHDARLVAVCHVHAITHLLTFNLRDFARMTTYGAGIGLIDLVTV